MKGKIGGREGLGEAASPEALALWGNEPLLMGRKEGYRGRVLAEVWRDGSVRVITSHGALIRQALAALSDQGSGAVLMDGVAKSPITGPHDDAEFLGRVIVELGKDGSRIGVTGSDVALLRRQAAGQLRLLAKTIR
jgi:hypothetical protein